MRSEIEARILAAAIGLFAVQGYHRTTVKEVAAAAKVSSAAVYRIFQSKANLFEEALRSAAAQVINPSRSRAGALNRESLPAYAHRLPDVSSALLQHSGTLLAQAFTSGDENWRRIALTAIQSLPLEDIANEKDHAEPAPPATRFRLIEFTHYQRRS